MESEMDQIYVMITILLVEMADQIYAILRQGTVERMLQLLTTNEIYVEMESSSSVSYVMMEIQVMEMDAVQLEVLKLDGTELEEVWLQKILVMKYEEMEKDLIYSVHIETMEIKFLQMDETLHVMLVKY